MKYNIIIPSKIIKRKKNMIIIMIILKIKMIINMKNEVSVSRVEYEQNHT
jgi:hypothetical protein